MCFSGRFQVTISRYDCLSVLRQRAPTLTGSWRRDKLTVFPGSFPADSSAWVHLREAFAYTESFRRFSRWFKKLVSSHKVITAIILTFFDSISTPI